MVSGRTRTAEQRAAGAETREDTGMGTVAAAGTERRAVAEMEEVAAVKIVAAEETEEAARKLRKRLGIWLETRNLLLPGTAGAERPSGMPGSGRTERSTGVSGI